MRTSLIRSSLLSCLLSLPCTSVMFALANGSSPPVALKLTPPNPAGAGAKLTFRRVFKSSTPEFIEISVREDSDDASYEIRQLDDDPGSAKFQVSPALRAKMFALAGQLHHFQGQDLDVHRKIANLGEKTFRWEQGSESFFAKIGDFAMYV